MGTAPAASRARFGPLRPTDLPNLYARKDVRRMDTFGTESARIDTEHRRWRASTPTRCPTGLAVGRHLTYAPPEGKARRSDLSNPAT
jgi:hypothetical protein